ncbi:hypothetical protein PSm6_54390 [Pseudomonas solani]|uniref:Uncharacterized protein n=1 Tax=Pseudomonas solani TaxID=2731552 RepID=A0ABM7LHG3_9PSED|nr:hypothetical protein PSm6_54390 [Pseudomonas solani]
MARQNGPDPAAAGFEANAPGIVPGAGEGAGLVDLMACDGHDTSLFMGWAFVALSGLLAEGMQQRRRLRLASVRVLSIDDNEVASCSIPAFMQGCAQSRSPGYGRGFRMTRRKHFAKARSLSACPGIL